MSVFLGQLSPADLAKLKAELAETMLTSFCYPRFFDYRSNVLRTRPVDRSKRQEVWLYLNSFDFANWQRIDVDSADLQQHIESLFIQFVQRNRAYFGEQGRKRMSDVRMLIGSSSLAVAQKLREHLKNHQNNASSFGSSRPILSWSATSNGRQQAMSWEQMVPATVLLQQQLQGLRGEVASQSPKSPLPAKAPLEPIPIPIPPQTIEASSPSLPPPTREQMQPRPTTPLPIEKEQANPAERAAVPATEEDVAIFEQVYHQLILWLRIQAVQQGIDIAGREPLQLLDLLRQRDMADETHLQIVATLLALAQQVVKNRRASLIDYKQALMFHLMHTNRSS